ncbi:MAG: isoamylase early set domain-containing protein [Bacteroidales bacterium]|nr:isoamylase early set domain-containing protein [Bacteroidales bacterium]HNW72030.1 isoamylase early set domain-containing protein [Bacteroidales bacterium]HPS49070.1 isoamylase early set domain-containing protein [Bacteroidales bacterium]
MSIEKKFLKSKPVCKVKFTLSGEPYNSASSVILVGDFNNWQIGETPLKKSKSGVWSATLDLETSKKHQFRYLIDGTKWENDPEADQFIPSGLGSENSVIEL